MAVHFHEEDLPADVSFPTGRSRSTRKPWAWSPAATGCASCSCPTARATNISCGSPAAATMPRRVSRRCWPIRSRLKIYHFARFDVGIMQAYLGIMAAPLYCTRTASRLVRTYTDRHGLKDLVKELLEHRRVEAAADQRLGRGRA